jgi:Zn-dependent protease
MENESPAYYSDRASGPPPLPPRRQGGWGNGKKGAGALAVIAVFLSKIKGFLIPALKFLPAVLKTGGTMILSIAAYAMMFGWSFAAGFVLLIFVHECGHLLAAKKLGLKVSAPMFIPFMGALITLREAPRNAWVEAQIGIGGPLLGSLGAALCIPLFHMTENPLFLALAYTGFFVNLFNLAPIGFLDGGRIVTVLSPWLWLVGAAIMVFMLFMHFNFIVLLILILSIPRLKFLFQKKTASQQRYFEATPSQRLIMAGLYFGLALALLWGMKHTFLETDHFNDEPIENVASANVRRWSPGDPKSASQDCIAAANLNVPNWFS